MKRAIDVTVAAGRCVGDHFYGLPDTENYSGTSSIPKVVVACEGESFEIEVFFDPASARSGLAINRTA